MWTGDIQTKRFNSPRELAKGSIHSKTLLSTSCESPRSSRGLHKESGYLLPGSPPAKTLPRPIVNKVLDPPDLPIIYMQKRRSFRVQPANQSIRVFVGSSLPGVVGPGKIYLNARLAGKKLMSRKFLPIVQCYRASEKLRQWLHLKRHLLSDFVSLLAGYTLQKRKSGFSLHQRYQMPRPLQSVDQISFPVPYSLSRLDFGRPQINPFLIRYPTTSPTIHLRAAPPPFATCPGKALPKIPPFLAVPVNMIVDRFFADRGASLQLGPAADHLRRPALSQSSLCVLPDFVSKPPGSSSPRPPLGFLMRLLGSIAPLAGILLNLSAYTACISSQTSANLAYSTSVSTPLINQSTLFSAHTFVSYHYDLLCGCKEIDSLPYGRCFFS